MGCHWATGTRQHLRVGCEQYADLGSTTNGPKKHQHVRHPHSYAVVWFNCVVLCLALFRRFIIPLLSNFSNIYCSSLAIVASPPPHRSSTGSSSRKTVDCSFPSPKINLSPSLTGKVSVSSLLRKANPPLPFTSLLVSLPRLDQPFSPSVTNTYVCGPLTVAT